MGCFEKPWLVNSVCRSLASRRAGWRLITCSAVCIWLTLNGCLGVWATVDAVSTQGFENTQCSSLKYDSLVQNILDAQELILSLPVNIEMKTRQRKRFILQLNNSMPLIIKNSNILARKLYYNGTATAASLFGVHGHNSNALVLPCALRGQYDLFVQSKYNLLTKFEVNMWKPEENWHLFNNSSHIHMIHTQNQMRKRQMIIKWEKSKLNTHVTHYCLVISAKRPNKDFCQAVEHYIVESTRYNREACSAFDRVTQIFHLPTEKIRKIDPFMTNIIYTGSYTQQVIRGLAINLMYYIDVFGVHSHRRNLTFHLSSTMVHFQRLPPSSLDQNVLNTVRLSGIQGLQVFSFEIPATNDQRLKNLITNVPTRSLRYLVVPCGGSEVDAKVSRQRMIISFQRNIYRPTYLEIPTVIEGDRYLIHFKPSDEDEVLRANKIMLAATTEKVFSTLPELPENTTVFEVRTQCTSAEIAWYKTHDIRPVSYCVIVMNVIIRNRSTHSDYANYCLDFSKRIMQHPQFHSMKCPKLKGNQSPASLLHTDTIYNLKPGNSYLIYIAIHLLLIEGKSLPYQSLQIKTYTDCPED